MKTWIDTSRQKRRTQTQMNRKSLLIYRKGHRQAKKRRREEANSKWYYKVSRKVWDKKTWEWEKSENGACMCAKLSDSRPKYGCIAVYMDG